jgi:hypothetical protein
MKKQYELGQILTPNPVAEFMASLRGVTVAKRTCLTPTLGRERDTPRWPGSLGLTPNHLSPARQQALPNRVPGWP